MRDSFDYQRIKFAITTSWDDGHPHDLKLAELLAKYGFRGTFYVPLKYSVLPVLKPVEIRYLANLGMEIGSHTCTHPILTELSPQDVQYELVESKKHLEDILGTEVSAFCYPKGKFNATVRSKVVEAKYRLARTTIGFEIKSDFDRFCMPTTFQIYPHERLTYFKHAVKEGNFHGLINWLFKYQLETNLTELSRKTLRQMILHGGILHFWGHSWEIEENDLWLFLETMLHSFSNRTEVSYLTNSQLLDI